LTSRNRRFLRQIKAQLSKGVWLRNRRVETRVTCALQ